MWEQAVTYLRESAAKALARSANREAVSCFEQALAALPHLPETRETLKQAYRWRALLHHWRVHSRRARIEGSVRAST